MHYVEFVHGYLENIDELLREARQTGLVSRCSIILWRGEAENEPLFDVPAYKAILSGLWKTFNPSSVKVMKDGEGELVAESLKDLMHMCRWPEEDDMEPMRKVRFMAGESPAAIVKSEPWANYGGPGPYGDNYALAIFTKEDQFPQILEGVTQELKDIGAKIGPIHEGKPVETIGLFTRILWKLR